jgi:hypothetical protein
LGQITSRTARADRQNAGFTAVKSHVLNPAVKAWLDNVIVPALVNEYLTLEQNMLLSQAPEAELACGRGESRSEGK